MDEKRARVAPLTCFEDLVTMGVAPRSFDRWLVCTRSKWFSHSENQTLVHNFIVCGGGFHLYSACDKYSISQKVLISHGLFYATHSLWEKGYDADFWLRLPHFDIANQWLQKTILPSAYGWHPPLHKEGFLPLDVATPTIKITRLKKTIFHIVEITTRVRSNKPQSSHSKNFASEKTIFHIEEFMTRGRRHKPQVSCPINFASKKRKD